MIQLPEQRLAAPLFVPQSLALRPPDSSLNRVGVKRAPELVRASLEIEPMQIVAVRGLKRRGDRRGKGRRSQLGVLPSASYAVLLDAVEQRSKLLEVVDKWITVVGERQRHQTISGEPAANTAHDDRIPQRLGRPTRRERDGDETVAALKTPKPSRRMEDRPIAVSTDELVPARVGQRVERVNVHLIDVGLVHRVDYTSDVTGCGARRTTRPRSRARASGANSRDANLLPLTPPGTD